MMDTLNYLVGVDLPERMKPEIKEVVIKERKRELFVKAGWIAFGFQMVIALLLASLSGVIPVFLPFVVTGGITLLAVLKANRKVYTYANGIVKNFGVVFVG